MRLRKVIYVAALATLFVSGCVASNKEVTAPAETTTEAPVEDLTKVTLAGKEVSVPIKVSDIVDMGFTLESTDMETIGFNQDCVGYFKSPDGAMLIANIGVQEGEGLTPEEGYAFDVLEDIGNTQGDGVLSVYGGISTSSSVEEVEAVYGEPTYNDGSNKLYYKIIGDAAYSDMVCVAVIDDKVKRVEVCNAKEFKEIPMATPSDSE